MCFALQLQPWQVESFQQELIFPPNKFAVIPSETYFLQTFHKSDTFSSKLNLNKK